MTTGAALQQMSTRLLMTNCMVNVKTVADGNESNSVARVNTIVDDDTSNFLATVNTVADDNKRCSTASVNAMGDDKKSNFVVSVNKVADDNKSNSMVSVNKVADENEAKFNVNTVNEYMNCWIVSVCLYFTTVTVQRPRTCRNTCEMSYFSDVREDQPA